METLIPRYLDFVRRFCPEITEEELSAFSTYLGEKTFDKKDIIVSAGRVQEEIGYVAQGLARSFIIDRDGNEITVGFHAENGFATDYVAFISQQPSRSTYICLEATTIITLSYDNVRVVYDTLPSIHTFGRLMAEFNLKLQQKRLDNFLLLTAEERYLDFTKRHPHLFNRVSLSHLSSFLGIERQTLTRIRQKLARK
jgi:CRP/FNR family transcriptional regulator, anaerobic regulatory protein